MEKEFKKFIKEDKTIDMKGLMKSFSKANFDAVTTLFTITGDNDVLLEVCKTYAITFALLEDALHFNFISCISEIYVRATNPKLAKFLDEKVQEISDDVDFDMDSDDDDDFGTNVQ